MDVLQVIKEEHESIRGLLNKAEKNGSATQQKQTISELLKRAQQHLRLEVEYLYPEVSGLFNEASSFIENSNSNHKIIRKKINDMQKLLNSKYDSAAAKKKLGILADELTKHFAHEESLLMPKLRQLIPTQEREDLGQVFLDFKETAMSGLKPKGFKS